MALSAAETKPLDMPLALGRAGVITTAPFTVALSGRYKFWLQTDRTPGVENFGCLTGDDGFEALCPGRVPELDLSWSVLDSAVAVARGGSDLEGWRRRQAALDPVKAAARLKAFPRLYRGRRQSRRRHAAVPHLRRLRCRGRSHLPPRARSPPARAHAGGLSSAPDGRLRRDTRHRRGRDDLLPVVRCGRRLHAPDRIRARKAAS